MKTRLAFLLFATTLSTAQAWAGKPTVLPDACGADIKFDVKTQKNPPAPTPPEEGKALLILITDPGQSGNYVVRFGMDGAWLGATKGSSYFVVSVTPGEHHFCSSIQHSGKLAASYVGITSFTAEAGKTYYLDYKVAIAGGAMRSESVIAGPAGAQRSQTVMVHGPMSASTSLFLATEDEGKYQVKVSELATSTPKN